MKNKFVNCHDIKDKKVKVKVEDLNFRPAVYALVFKDEKILLNRQWDGYCFPGGGVEKGETLDNALEREVWEETGLKVTPVKIVTVTQDFFISIESRKGLHSILIFYLCKNPKGKISTQNFDIYEKECLAAAEWVAVRDIKKLKFYNGVNSVKLIQQAYASFKKK